MSNPNSEPLFYVNVEGAIYDDNKWLMITRSEKEGHAGGTLSMPGGTVEHDDSSDETLEEALRREIREEVGVEVDENLRYVTSSRFVSDMGEMVLDIVFMCKYESGEPTAKNSHEVAAVEWMTSQEIENHDNAPVWTRRSMRRAEELRTTTS